MAILEQLQELENSGASDAEALRTQFAAYDEMLDARDAEEWDGRGDLMVREWRRAHLHIEQQDPAKLHALGYGSLRERDLFELLSMHGIRVLYDFRASPEASGMRSPGSLEIACKGRGMVYRHIALGRETAYGILKHLREDEGRNALAELVWHARRKPTAFLGAEEEWRSDPRLAIASRLQEAGHTVLHILADGRTEPHPADVAVPEHLAGEEHRLRLLEKQRLAGELRRPQKSAASRSTEVVAQRLAMPQHEVDAAAELRKANTQAELCRAQRRLADLQRRKEDSADVRAGLGPKLVNVNKWVKAEAAQQREHLAAGRTKDGKEKPKAAGEVEPGGGRDPAAGPDGVHAAAGAGQPEHPDAEVLLVECLGCGVVLPWEVLQDGDGRCVGCAGMQPAAVEAQVAAHVEAQVAALWDPPAEVAAHVEAQMVARVEAQEAAHGDPPAVVAAHVGAGDAGPGSAAPAKSTWRARRRGQHAGAASAARATAPEQ